jgi:PhnB protein
MKLPEKSTAITPHLTVRDVAQAVTFYEQAFGFKRKFMLPGPGGRVMHAELVHQDCTVMLGPESPERGMLAPVTSGAVPPVSLFVYVDDVDRLHAQALAAGAHEVLPPNDQFFGARTCLLLDPDGHQWMFATHTREVSVDEMLQASRERHV